MIKGLIEFGDQADGSYVGPLQALRGGSDILNTPVTKHDVEKAIGSSGLRQLEQSYWPTYRSSDQGMFSSVKVEDDFEAGIVKAIVPAGVNLMVLHADDPNIIDR